MKLNLPNKKLFLILAGIVVFIAAAYFLMPKQKRLGDDYKLDQQINIEQPTVKKPVEMIAKDLQIFYYKKTDTACTAPVSITFPDLDRRKDFQEITALHALLDHDIPDDYFSALISPTTLNGFKISQGVAYIDLSIFLTFGNGPCAFEARKKQIINTMSQFDKYKEIILLVDGKEIE